MYSGAVAAVVLMFLYYTGDFTGQCKLHEFFISFNMLVCIALSVISIMPKVQVTPRDLIWVWGQPNYHTGVTERVF